MEKSAENKESTGLAWGAVTGLVMALVFSPVTAKANSSLKISEVKNLVSTLNPSETCLDEYLKRRRQAIWKVSLSPAIIAVSGTLGLFGGVFAGKAISRASTDPWADLVYVVSGMLLGGIGSVGISAADSVIEGVQLVQVNRIMKAIAETRLNRPGKYQDRLYLQYTNEQGEGALARDEFFRQLVQLDASGQLCDGSLLKHHWFERKKALKNRLARPKQFLRSLDAHQSDDELKLEIENLKSPD